MREPSDAGIEAFSYATEQDPRVKRMLIRLVERLTGQPHLKALYDENRAGPRTGENFWDAAIRMLNLKIACNEEALARLPRTGPLMVVANHPFGVLDGLVISHLIGKVRPDFRILTNSVLYRAEEIRPHLLLIDFADTPAAMATNIGSRAAARAHLVAGGCLIVFPAGGASTTPSLWARHALDAEWKTFTARLILHTKAPVAPVFFAGQNSRLFQLASHISLTLRLSLFFREVHNKIGSALHVRIGEVIPFAVLAGLDGRVLMQRLRAATYGLGAEPAAGRQRMPRH